LNLKNKDRCINVSKVSNILMKIVIIFMAIWTTAFSIDLIRMAKKKHDAYKKLFHDFDELKTEVEKANIKIDED